MPRHYSPSQLRQWLRCPQQWAYRYIEKRIMPPGVALVVGGAVHVPAGIYHQRGLNLGTEWTPDAALAQMGTDEAETIARDAFGSLAAGRDPGGEYPDGPAVDWKHEDETEGEAADRAVSLAREYVTGIAPSCGRPLMAETRLPPIQGQAFNLVCKPDLVVEECDTGRIVLRDLKTSAKAPSGIKSGMIAVDDDAHRQLALYRFAISRMTDLALNGSGIDFVWGNQTGAHSVHAPVVLTDGDEEEAIGQLREMDKSVSAGNFIRNTANNMCSPRWCGYFGICRPHRVAEQVPAMEV